MSCLVLLLLVLYVFAIIFTDSYHGGEKTRQELKDDCDEDARLCVHEIFGGFLTSFRHLLILGTILDDITACTDAIRASEKATQMMIVFMIFVLISSFTMLNMLIGILCEVVTATSDGEKKKNTEASVRKAIRDLFATMDEDGSGDISRAEFLDMSHDKTVMDALQELDVEPKHFDMYAELLFKENEAGHTSEKMDLEHLMDMIMRLQPDSKVSALDFASFQQDVYKNHSLIKHQIVRIDTMMTSAIPYDPDQDEDRGPEDEDEEMEVPKITMADLAKFSSEEIAAEIHRRLGPNAFLPGNVNLPGGLETSGVSMDKMVEAFETLCVGQPDQNDKEAWSKETYSC